MDRDVGEKFLNDVLYLIGLSLCISEMLIKSIEISLPSKFLYLHVMNLCLCESSLLEHAEFVLPHNFSVMPHLQQCLEL